MTVEVSLLIAFLSLLISAIVGISNLKRNASKDNRESATEYTMIAVKLENISNGVFELKSEIRNMRTDIQELRERLVVVEQSTKSAHHRIDCIATNAEKGEKHND